MSSNKTSKTAVIKKNVFSPFKLMVEKMGEHLGIPRMNMREVGSEFGVSTSGISDFNKKDYVPSETMMRWCKKEGVSIDWMLGGNNPSKAEEESREKAKKTLLSEEDEEDMYRLKYEQLQIELIEALKEISSLKDQVLKKVAPTRKASGE